MRIITGNIYIKIYRFNTKQEQLVFANNQEVTSLSINSNQPEFYYCFMIHDSINQEKKEVIILDTQDQEDKILFISWPLHRLLILKNEDKVYLIDHNYEIKKTIEIFSEIIGFYIIDDNRLLIIEEIGLKIINSSGLILVNKPTNLILKVIIEKNELVVSTEDEEYTMNLN